MAANGVEIATGYVTVLAKMPGIGKTINSALGGVNTSSVGKKIGQDLADSVNKSLKSQVAKKFADATAAAYEKNTAASKRLADAEHALVKARAQHGTASAKVTAAEEKLDALRKSGKASAGDLERAEAALAKAQAEQVGTGRAVAGEQNKVAEAKRNATDASKEYTDALAKEQSKSEQALAWMPLATARIDEISNKWKNAGARISGVGDSLTNSITKPAVIATGAVGSLIGALGFKRLVGIDTARGQFKGLGMDADAVMQQVDRGVNNTALSMAQGASLAVGILATGAVPLGELESQIKRVANVSSAYNVDSEQAAYLLNNVLTKQKVTWGDLSQMQMNQIPIVTQLAEYYGVAGAEIMKMAQDGLISIEDLNATIDQNAGAAAEEYAKTWRGVTSNILSNLGKIGAKFLEPTFNIMKEEATEFLELLRSDEFATLATDIGERVAEMVGKVIDKIRDLVGWWADLDSGQKKTILTAAGVIIALGPVLKIVGKLTSGIGLLINAGKGGIAVAQGTIKAYRFTKDAMTGYQIAMKGAQAATFLSGNALKSYNFFQNKTALSTKLVTGAISGLGKAMTFLGNHPIILVISAIIAALVLFFTKTELGQKIWKSFTQFLKEAWENVSSFFVATYENYIKPVFDGIATVAQWVFNNILLPAFEGVKTAFQAVGNFFQTAWTGYIKPVFDGIAAVATWVWENILFPIFNLIAIHFAIMAGILVGIWEYILKPFFEALGEIFTWLYENVVEPVIGWIVDKFDFMGAAFLWFYDTAVKPSFDAVGKIFKWVWEVVIRVIINAVVAYIKMWAAVFTWLYQNIVKPVFDGIAAVIKWAWEVLIKPVVTAFWDGLKVLGGVFKWLYENVVRPVWDSISSKIKAVWEKGIKPVIDTLVKVVKSDPKKAFEMARDGIGRAWDGIKEIAKKPVKFVIETVVNGLIGTLNKIPGVNLDKVKLPKGFAGGGVLPGYMSAKRDDVLMPMRSGEGVLVPEVVRGLGPGFVHALNAAGNAGGVNAVRQRFGHIGAGLARGGMVHPLPGGRITTYWMGYPGHKGMDFAKPQGSPMFAAAPGVVNHARYNGGWGNMVQIDHGGGLQTRYAHIMPGGFNVGVGDIVKAGQNIARVGTTGMSTGPHLHYEVVVGGRQVNPLPYVNGAAMPSGADGEGSAFGDMLGLGSWAKNLFEKAFPGGGMWIDVAGGAMTAAVESVIEWGKKKLSFGGPTLYDNGGWLDPGTHLVQNKTRSPEPILTSGQWENMRRAADGRGGDVYVQNPFTGDYLLAQVDERASKQVDRKLAPMNAGHMKSRFGVR